MLKMLNLNEDKQEIHIYVDGDHDVAHPTMKILRCFICKHHGNKKTRIKYFMDANVSNKVILEFDIDDLGLDGDDGNNIDVDNV